MNKITIRKNGHGSYLVDGQTLPTLEMAWNAALKLAGDGGEVGAGTSLSDAEFAQLVALRQGMNQPDGEPVVWRFAQPGFPVQDAIYNDRIKPAGGVGW
jgi:hypothetical protein